MTIKLCYYNQHWNVYLYTEGGYTSWNEKSIKIISTEEGEYRLREYDCPEIPIYGFGFWYNEANKRRRPGHGGEWSSNPSAINRVFGTNLIDVAVDQMAVSVPLEWLKELLGDRVMWEPDDIYGEWITHVTGKKNDYMKWITLENELKEAE